jgi:hypothetical protein
MDLRRINVEESLHEYQQSLVSNDDARVLEARVALDRAKAELEEAKVIVDPIKDFFSNPQNR